MPGVLARLWKVLELPQEKPGDRYFEKKCSGRAGFMGCELGPNSNNVLYEFRFVLPNKTPFLT